MDFQGCTIVLRYHAGDKIRIQGWTREQKPVLTALERGVQVYWDPEPQPDPELEPAPRQSLFVPWNRVVHVRSEVGADCYLSRGL